MLFSLISHNGLVSETTAPGPTALDGTADDIERAASAIGGQIRTTPIVEVPGAEIGLDATLVLKLEYLQHSGSFKARGAANFVVSQPIADDGIVAASGGNHGAAVAWAAGRFGHDAHIFVPTTATPAKVERLRQYGANVHEVGDVYGDALAASQEYLEHHHATSIHAYDDPVVMAGAGTCARELDRAAPRLDAVMVACGGGGLAGGAATWYGTRAEIVAVETFGTPAFAAATAAGEPVDIEVTGLVADALGATRIGATGFRALRAVDATSVLVSDDAVMAAREHLWNWLRIVVEPAAAAPVAALMTGSWVPDTAGARIGIVLCGANTTLDLTPALAGGSPVTSPT